jgi:hypothetical protein
VLRVSRAVLNLNRRHVSKAAGMAAAPRKLKTKDIRLIKALMRAGKLLVQDIADRSDEFFLSSADTA